MFLLFSHKLTSRQEEEARSLGVKEFISLPKELQDRFSNIPADLESLDEYVRPFMEYLLKESKVGDMVLIQGDVGLVYKLVGFAYGIGLKPVYATTQRRVVERMVDGKSIKISEFEHVRFRKY